MQDASESSQAQSGLGQGGSLKGDPEAGRGGKAGGRPPACCPPCAHLAGSLDSIPTLQSASPAGPAFTP